MTPIVHFSAPKVEKKVEKIIFSKKQKKRLEVPSIGTCSENFRSVGLLVWPGGASQIHISTHKHIPANKGNPILHESVFHMFPYLAVIDFPTFSGFGQSF